MQVMAEQEDIKERILAMMNDLSMDLPSNCWITEIVEQGGSRVTLDGVTFSNYIVADLMNNMEKSDRFRDVALVIAEEGQIEEHKVLKFTLNSKVIR